MNLRRESILDRIARHINRRVEDLYREEKPDRLDAAARRAVPSRGFLRRLTETAECHGFALITEFKRASPSEGTIARHLHAGRVALDYELNGAACLSVLTEEEHFSGSPDDLRAARAASSLPVLRKDFILDPIQIVEARAMGADAILLIAAMLSRDQLEKHIQSTVAWEMDALVEVHTEEELDVALEVGARLIGINNRNLQTFETDLNTTTRLAPRAVEAGAFVVGESGVRTPGDLIQFRRTGVKAALVGTSLMRASRPGKGVSALLPKVGRPGTRAAPRGWIKVCGVTTPAAVNAARQAGADALGLVFAPSPRQLSLEKAGTLARHIPPGLARVGVFVNATDEEISEAHRAASLDWIQLHGDESPERCRELALKGYLVIKGLQMGTVEDLEQVRRYAGVADAVLLDSQHPELRGGTGKPFDWQLAGRAACILAGAGTRSVLAGGLGPDNVAQAVVAVGPGGVDASSGLESRAGIKDAEKVDQYVATARRAFGGRVRT